MAPKLKRVMRLDSTPVTKAIFTAEGYLNDRPILTSTGIFEYVNEDGSIRRELRLPEEVFDPESLASYKGKPIIVTHDAGLVTKDNVHEEQIGTILTEGYRSGDDVRAEIVIHDTDEMKKSGLKELSLGYNLDLEETTGEWNGQPYDAIQRNIRINHLALVSEARAGDHARLNIDGREKTLKGGKQMSKTKKNVNRNDGVLSPEELKKAIEEYKARRAAQTAVADSEEGNAAQPETDPATVKVADGEETAVTPVGEEATAEEKVAAVKKNRDRRDEEGEPEDIEGAKEVIAQQDSDMNILFDIIDTLLAEKAFDEAEEPAAVEGNEDEDEAQEDPEAVPTEGMDEDEDEDEASEVVALDEDDDAIPSKDVDEIPTGDKMNADSVDKMIRTRIRLGMIGKQINLDGLENMSVMKAKKAIIKAVRPSMRLDGRSEAFINAAFECACDDINKSTRKGTDYQKKQMFNKDSRQKEVQDETSSISARQRMIDRRQHKA